jgi:IS30 family transposase
MSEQAEILRDKLQEYMASNGMTLRDIAVRIKRSPSTVHRFIRGQGAGNGQTPRRVQMLIEGRL